MELEKKILSECIDMSKVEIKGIALSLKDIDLDIGNNFEGFPVTYSPLIEKGTFYLKK